MNPEDITTEWVLDRLERYPHTVEWCILALYDRQTATEQESHTTAYHNGVGFNAVDADLGSSFAKQIMARRKRGYRPGRCLSQPSIRNNYKGQLYYARKMLPKYRKQLVQYMQDAIREANRLKEAQNV